MTRSKVSAPIGTRKGGARKAKRVTRAKKATELAPPKRRIGNREAVTERDARNNGVVKKTAKSSTSTRREQQQSAQLRDTAPDADFGSVSVNAPMKADILSPPVSWLELGKRHAPKTIDEVALPESVREALRQAVQTNGPVNLLLAGPPGIGKSAVTKLLVKTMNVQTYDLDATKEGSMEALRGTNPFVRSVGFDDRRKCVVVEELDSASPPFLQALRGETMTDGTGFLMTCNSLDKIPPAVRSRCTMIDLTNMTSQQRTELQVAQLDRARAIINAEQCHTDEATLQSLVEAADGDFRIVLQKLALLISGTPALRGRPNSDTMGKRTEFSAAEHKRLAAQTAGLLDDLVALLSRFLLLPEGGIETLALTILHFWTIEAAQRSPILAFISPQRECGKSTAMTCVSMLVPRPVATVNLTPAALYERTDAGDTLLIDEADKLLNTRSELSTLLKGGFQRNGTVMRSGMTYNLWSPKVVAKIGPIEDPPLASRCIPIQMVRKLQSEYRERLHTIRHAADFESVKKRCESWAPDSVHVLSSLDPTTPDTFGARQREKWEPLFAIGELAGSQWSAKSQQAAVAIESAALEDEDIGSMLLADARTIFDEGRRDKLRSVELMQSLRAMPDRPWSANLSWPRKIARVLATYGIKSKNIRFAPDDQKKGFERAQFEKAWERYLPAADAPAGTDGTTGTA
jgi:putative DNA primase/helicase